MNMQIRSLTTGGTYWKAKIQRLPRQLIHKVLPNFLCHREESK